MTLEVHPGWNVPRNNIKRVDPGLIRVEPAGGGIIPGVWVIGKARATRGVRRCQLSGFVIRSGSLCYKPLTNGNDRGQRMLAIAVEQKLGERP